MPLSGKKLGLLVASSPGQPGFEHALALATVALEQHVRVYLYCLDEAVRGLNDHRLQELRQKGLVLYACAYGAQKRQIVPSDLAVFGGLGALSDLMSGADRFLSFR